jgi:hypothetical protein
MTKSTSKTKGNRFEKVNFHISYYTKAFFDPDGELEDGEEKVTTKSSPPTVKIPVKIEASGGDSRDSMLLPKFNFSKVCNYLFCSHQFN